MTRSASPTQRNVFIKEHLLYAQAKAEAGEYADALSALQETKGSSANNIYIRALEQQLSNLLDLLSQDALTEERKLEILEPMSEIIERALGSLSTHEQNEAPSLQKNPQRVASVLTAEERVEALEKLKVQYFEQAATHLSVGEYELALGEIRRVFVIDPDNATAQQYETVIQELLKLNGTPADASDAPDSSRHLMEEYERSLEQVSPLTDRVSSLSHSEPSAPDDIEQPATSVVPEIPDEDDKDSSPVLPEALEHLNEDPPRDRYVPVVVEPSSPPIHVPPHTSEEDEPVVFSHERAPSTVPRRRPSRTVILSVIGLLFSVVGGIIIFSSQSTDGVSFNTTAGGTNAQNDQQTVADRTVLSRTSPTDGVSSVNSRPADRSQLTTRELSAQSASRQTDGPASKTEQPVQSDGSLLTKHSPTTVPVIGEDVVPSTPPVSISPTAQGAVSDSQTLTVSEPEPEPFIAVEKEPQLVKFATPQIPTIAWETGAEATIVVRVLIDGDGRPVKTRVLKSTNTVVESAVLAAITKSTFTPGIMGKTPVTAWLTIPLKFKRAS